MKIKCKIEIPVTSSIIERFDAHIIYYQFIN